MGHFCRICGRQRPNERYSGKGHARHICKDCQRLPRAERLRIEALDEIDGFLRRQSNISRENLRRLAELAEHGDPEVRGLAAVVFEIGKVHPHRRRRLGWIRHRRPELWQRMVHIGLVEQWPEEAEEPDSDD